MAIPATVLLPQPTNVVQPYGVVLNLQASDVSFDVEVQRAPDSGGSPGTPVTIARVSGSTTTYVDKLPNDNAYRHYRIRHVRDGYTAGAYTSYLMLKPVLLQPLSTTDTGDVTFLTTAGSAGTGTVPSTCTTGDMVYASAANTWSNLAIGATRKTLQVVAGIPSWVNSIVPGADNNSSWTLGTSGTARWYGVYVGTEVVVGTDPGGTYAVRVTGKIQQGAVVTGQPAEAISNSGGYQSINAAASGFVSLMRVNTSFAAPSAVVDGDTIADVFFGGYNGTAFVSSLSLRGVARGNWATGPSKGTSLIVRNTPSGSNTARNIWEFADSGELKPLTDNSFDLGTTLLRSRVVYGYTGDFTTAVTSPILQSGSATDLLLKYNITTKLTIGTAVITPAVLLTTLLSGTSGAGFRLPHGAAPTSPVDGDMWTTTAGLFVQINGTTKTVTLT